MQVTIQIGNIYSYVRPRPRGEILQDLTMELSYAVPGAEHSPQFEAGLWDGRIRLFYKNGRFFTGLLGTVLEVLHGYGVDVEFDDTRERPKLGPPLEFKTAELRDYQKEAVNVSIKKQRALVKIASGGGKTEVIAAITGKLNIPTTLLVHRQELMFQARDRLKQRLGVPIGMAGCGNVDLQKINVMMMQTAVNAVYRVKKMKKKKEVSRYLENDKKTRQQDLIKIYKHLQNTQLFMIDEAHHAPCESSKVIHRACDKAFYRFGFSATPYRDDNADLLITGLFGRKSVDISASDLIRSGHLVPLKIFLVEYEHKDIPRYLPYPDLYKYCIVENLARNMEIMKISTKLAAANKTVLISVNHVKHGENILALFEKYVPDIRIRFVHGSRTAEERDEYLKLLCDKKLDCVISTTVWGEGVDLPSLDAIIIAKAQKSKVDSLQLVGRVSRVDGVKTEGIVIDFQDKEKRYLSDHSRERRKIYSEEDLFEMIPVRAVDEIRF